MPAHRAAFAPEAVTVCVTSAVLAPAPAAPAAAETPVFVDDSGTRKRLLRIAGVLLGLLAIGFLGLVGIALATPSVATSVGLGDATPFVVPGAAASPPAKAPGRAGAGGQAEAEGQAPTRPGGCARAGRRRPPARTRPRRADHRPDPPRHQAPPRQAARPQRRSEQPAEPER